VRLNNFEAILFSANQF